jgi:hypothetical protein
MYMDYWALTEAMRLEQEQRHRRARHDRWVREARQLPRSAAAHAERRSFVFRLPFIRMREA